MSLTQALTVALSGLNTSTQLINLASQNISNAQTPGYTLKTATVSNVEYGNQSGGSQIAGYGQSGNQALTANYNASTTTAGFSNTQNNYMTQVQTILNASSSNPALSNSISQFASAWNQYSAQPNNPIQQQAVVGAGQNLVSTINTISTQIDALSSQANSDVTTSVSTLNAALKQVATLNGEISAATTSGQPTGNFVDQLNTTINTIASYTSVSIQSRPNGQVALYTTSGQPMVDASLAAQYSYNGSTITDSYGTNVTGILTGGTLQAQTSLIDTSPAALASSMPGVGTIGKLQAQITTLIGAFTAPTSSTPNDFATTYTTAYTASTAATGTQNGANVASSFFTTAGGFAVNANLLNGTSALPQTNSLGIAGSFNATANYATSGLVANGVTYSQLGTAILSGAQQAANTISTQSTAATSQQKFYQTSLSSATGVNIDTELANLVAYQNSYAASAHVISTVNTLLTNLMTLLP